ncbi:tyrosine--tRNA ligase [Candidatus Saccharibacteria bacterium]|nr:tyrosine--tRNA ligase [Candidatus Saccharibacteria bacterium]
MMGERAGHFNMEARQPNEASDRFASISKLVQNEALLEAAPSLQFLNERSVNDKPGGSIYYGTGLTTPKAISIGIPFDMLGMMLTAEKVRQAGGFEKVYHHIADTHAKTNDWIDEEAVDAAAMRTIKTLEAVRKNLQLDNFEFMLASGFDTTPEYSSLVETFDASEEHEYVRREMADMEWYRTNADVRLKLGWVIQSKETEMGFDERRFDREYLKFHPEKMSFIYAKPGRTFDTKRPKASPYISIDGENRLLLAPGVNVKDVFEAKNDSNLGGAKKHIESIVRLYEDLYGSLGKIGVDTTLESKVQAIIDRCFDGEVVEQIKDVPVIVEKESPLTEAFVGSLIENAQILIPETGVMEKLKSAELEGRRLRIKMGFDPTSPDLHLGHAVSMQQLRKFQQLGHLPVIIIGDFTGRIGDPTGRNKSRPIASAEELVANAKTYIDQLGKIVDVSDIEVHYNSEWLQKMDLTDVIRLLAQGTLSQVITRDDFRKRLEENSPIALHEIIYPYLQGMDSIAVNADIEVGGVDQLYAFQAARVLQDNKGDDPEALVMMPLLRGLDGTKKMSKSIGNYVGLSDAPEDMFGKIMSIPDTLIDEYIRLASSFDPVTAKDLISRVERRENVMEVKIELAKNITTIYHDEKAADRALDHFNKQFRSKDLSEQVFEPVVIPTGALSIIDILTASGTVPSRGQARRLVDQGAVQINGEKVGSGTGYETLPSTDGLKIRVGRNSFIETKVQ